MQSKRARWVWTVWFGVCLLLACLLAIGSGCKTSGRQGKADTRPIAGQSDNRGYALLADLSGDEKDVSKLRFLKRERPELKALLQEISATNAAIATLTTPFLFHLLMKTRVFREPSRDWAPINWMLPAMIMELC
jgi:hypothetical protein